MALYQVNAGDRILAADSVQFFNILKGVAASGENILLIYNAGALTFQPSSDPSAGTRVLTIKNNAGTTLFSARYDGLLELLAAAAAPASPVVGSAYFDTLLKFLRVHDGTNWVSPSDSPQPNLILNSDFGRRTVFGLAMPEVFADTSGFTLDAGTAGSVAANVWTMGTAARTRAKWGLSSWRDVRVSATFKANEAAAAGTYDIVYARYTDGNNSVFAYCQNGNFRVDKIIAGVTTNLATVAQALTLNRWYWIEIEAQGTTFIAKLYDTGGTVPGVTKASSTLLQTLTGTAADAAVIAGYAAVDSIRTGATAGTWGGIATGNGGVYVETWLPESWSVSFGGTLGGQAIGYDDAADSGPLNKQWTPITYIPAASRTITGYIDTPDGSVLASTAYTASWYEKTTGIGGSGVLVRLKWDRMNSASSTQGNSTLDDAGETSFTRKTVTATTEAGTRRSRLSLLINPSSTATGTARFSLPQLEQGSAATAWRGAPADDAPIVWTLRKTATTSTATGTVDEMDPRDLAINAFLPWDATVVATAEVNLTNSGANTDRLAFYSAAAIMGGTTYHAANAQGTTAHQMSARAEQGIAAGKTRIALRWQGSAGTTTLNVAPDPLVTITATRGK